jgi:ACR3 family arsenite transporter
VVIPLIAGALSRQRLIRRHGSDENAIKAFTARLKPWSVIGLLATVVLLFAFQAAIILANPLLILLIAIPIVIQSYGIFAMAYAWAYAWKIPHNIAAPCAMIGTSKRNRIFP